MPQLSTPSAGTPPPGLFVKFVEFSRLVEKKDEKPTVYGIATWERPDSDNEVCDYESAVPIYQAWSKKALQRTKGAGQEISLGNIRLMHGAEVGGKVTSIDFRDDAKEIAVGSEPVDDGVYQQLKGGFLTGYSQGGSYAWRECEECKSAMPLQQGMNFCQECGKMVPVRYGLKRLAEISYVDSPAIGEGFEHVKVGGSSEIIKFKKHKNQEATVAKTKTVAGEKLEASAFAYVGDPEKTATWKFPIKFSDEAKTKRHIRNALARIDQAKGIPADKMEEVKAKIHAAAKEHGIDVGEETKAIQAKHAKVIGMLKGAVDKAAESSGLKKGLYAVSAYARLLEDLSYLWEQACWEREVEGDESDVPDELRDQLDQMVETFISMAEEEARELAANNNKNDSPTGAIKTMTPEQLDAFNKAAQAVKRGMMSHFAKAASHHEKMADKHEALADEHEKAAGMHETMADNSECKCGKASKADNVAKEDVSTTPEHDAIHTVLADQQSFHKGMAKCEMAKAKMHDGMAAMHDKFAEHNRKMAEDHDESADKADTAAILKGERDAADPTPAAPATPKTPTMDDDVAKAAAARRETPEYKKSIAEIAEAQVAAEVEALKTKTLAPLGVELVDGKAVAKAGTTGTLRAVARGGGSDSEFEFATCTAKSNTGGL